MNRSAIPPCLCLTGYSPTPLLVLYPPHVPSRDLGCMPHAASVYILLHPLWPSASPTRWWERHTTPMRQLWILSTTTRERENVSMHP